MGYVAYLDEDPIGQVSTVVGWGDFKRAVDKLPVSGHEQLIALAEHGWCQDLDLLLAQLGALDDPVASDLAVAIRAKRQPNHEALFVSSGIDDPPGKDDLPLDVAYGPDGPLDIESADLSNEPPSSARPFANIPAPAPPRPLTPPECRVDFAATASAIDRLVSADRQELSALWAKAVNDLRREVTSWVLSASVSPSDILQKLEGIHLNLAPFVARLTAGGLQAYHAGRDIAERELRGAGVPLRFDAQGISPEDPFSLGHFAGLLQARSFVTARDMQAKVFAAISNGLLNAFNTESDPRRAVHRLDELFTALEAGQLISPGTPGYDYTQPAVQETTVRTLYNDAMNGGRNDLYERNAGFVLGTMRTEVAEGHDGDRSHPLSAVVDGLKIRLSDSRRRALTGSLHFNDRGLDVPLTQMDEPIEWSTDAEIDRAIAAGKQLSSRFF